MNNYLQRLLIVVSLALCGLIAVQWVREVGLRKRLQQQANTYHQQEELIRSLQADLRQAQAEIRRLEELRKGLSAQARNGENDTIRLQQALRQSEAKVAQLRQHAEAYSRAFETANQNIRQANGNIQRQNRDLQQLAEERNVAVKRLNELVEKYNQLVIESKQEGFVPGTNAAKVPASRR